MALQAGSVAILASITAHATEGWFWIWISETPGPTGRCASEYASLITGPAKRPVLLCNTVIPIE